MNEPGTQPKPQLPADDPDTLLKMMDVEIANRRAKRLSGDGGDRRNARLMGMMIILLILIAAMGALVYLKTSRYPDATHHPASPAPAASTPRVR